ncbi:alpha/beta fold hydrolase BchO [Polynucleobacter sp. IMCC 29146]|uniref:alpha/beta fold hydrolase BchO n=1 Tax=Polynucleobacter sp. IMCC 29146 TaxID=2780953 RepID=UPI001F2749FC|nr:alpha/beta fold hydrolase [Polynucleobacter sp. IMCC 29146]
MNSLSRIPNDWPNRTRSRSIAVGTLLWHVQIAGDAGPTILLLHGTGASAHSWSEIINKLTEHARVVVPDLPGHAFTLHAPISSLRLDNMALELQKLMKALALPGPALVVGHSAGALLALRYAEINPEIQCIIGLNPSLVPPPASYTQLFGPLLSPLTRSSLASFILAKLAGASSMIDRLLDSTNTILPEARRVFYRRLFSQTNHVLGAMNFMAAADITAVLNQAKTCRAKLIWVLGKNDLWIPEQRLRQIISSYFPQATVIEWSGGHLMHELEPQKTVELILHELLLL